jgi:hypothetical protein
MSTLSCDQATRARARRFGLLRGSLRRPCAGLLLGVGNDRPMPTLQPRRRRFGRRHAGTKLDPHKGAKWMEPTDVEANQLHLKHLDPGPGRRSARQCSSPRGPLWRHSAMIALREWQAIALRLRCWLPISVRWLGAQSSGRGVARSSNGVARSRVGHHPWIRCQAASFVRGQRGVNQCTARYLIRFFPPRNSDRTPRDSASDRLFPR